VVIDLPESSAIAVDGGQPALTRFGEGVDADRVLGQGGKAGGLSAVPAHHELSRDMMDRPVVEPPK